MEVAEFAMETVSAELFVLDQFPRRYWPLIPSMMKTAYAAADDLIKDTPILQVESARWNRGRLISWAVDFGMERLIKSGALPFDYRWQSFAKPTGRYLELQLTHSVLSISQVADPTKQPRNVIFRQNGRLNNMPYFDLPEFADESRIIGLPHLLIAHGYQILDFVHLGVPHPMHQFGFTYLSPNLVHLPHEQTDERPAAEDTDIDFESLGLLKQDLERWIADNDG